MSFGAEARARLTVLPVYALVMPWRCVPSLPDRGEIPPSERVPAAPPHPPSVRLITLPEEVVLRAVGAGQPLFLRCWARAQRADPGLDASKLHLHLEIDPAGKVTAVRSDAGSPAFAGCLAAVARQLPFPAPGRPAVVELPLMFR
jgi:hypothetical protein